MVKNFLMKTAWVGIHALGGLVGIRQTGPGCRGPFGRQSMVRVSLTAVQEYGGTRVRLRALFRHGPTPSPGDGGNEVF
jgi:hypothetical protein